MNDEITRVESDVVNPPKVPVVKDDTYEFYGIPDSFKLYHVSDESKIMGIITKFNIGKNYINTATGKTILACAEELDIDSVSILERLR